MKLATAGLESGRLMALRDEDKPKAPLRGVLECWKLLREQIEGLRRGRERAS